jgi:hypothetical protein
MTFPWVAMGAGATGRFSGNSFSITLWKEQSELDRSGRGNCGHNLIGLGLHLLTPKSRAIFPVFQKVFLKSRVE